MPYPSLPLGKIFLSCAIILLAVLPGMASPSSQIFFQSIFSKSHNSPTSALYVTDTVQEHSASGFVRRSAVGDLVITVPQAVAGLYKIRFFDERKNLLFEIRKISDPLLIVEKYNFEHAGQFIYELYKDTVLVEKSSFTIRRE